MKMPLHPQKNPKSNVTKTPPKYVHNGIMLLIHLSILLIHLLILLIPQISDIRK